MNKLFYLTPAKFWRNALPLGNGHIGVMAFGGKKNEKLCFNDTNLWSGYPKNQDNPESLKYLDKVRQLIFDGKNAEAHQLAEQKLIGHYSESFLPLGEVNLKFSGINCNNYTRELDIEKSLYTVKLGECNREAFASFPDKVFAYKITNNTPFNLTISGKSKLHYEIHIENNTFGIVGNAPDYAAPSYLRSERNPIKYNEGKGMSFALATKIITDGQVSSNSKSVHISKATEIIIYFATATGFKSYNEMPETSREYAYNIAKKHLESITLDYETIKKSHIADYTSIYSKQTLTLNSDIDLPTNKLLKLAKSGSTHNGLVELVYNYGKYMTISSSRLGGNAINLQGIWNNSIRPAWSSNYTTNINTEMNYWGMSQCNLTECAEPYVRLVYEIMQHGKSTAKVNYGCDGFACNHNVDIWKKTAPVQGDSNYMYAPLCGVWLANELYEHLRYGGMEEYREKIEEITTEAVKFICDYLVEHNGEYVTCPSASPEASFVKYGKKCHLDYASAFELGLIRQAFINFKEYSNDTQLLNKVEEKLSKLKPFTCGETGINEWGSYYQMPEKGHRHFSPLYALYPAKVIGYYRNPQERDWVDKLYLHRTDNSSGFIGWSSAWAICLAGRLRRPDRAKMIIDKMLASSFFSNLFDTHPPFIFQIDGNLGFMAGINELLATEEDGVIELLPALPKEFKSGEIKNLRTATGNVISFTWFDGKITSLNVEGKTMKLRNLHIADNINLSNVELIK